MLSLSEKGILRIEKKKGECALFSSDHLICPLCGGKLSPIGNSLCCPARHTFDFAKSGYVNLNTHPSESGDDKSMARSRQTFLRKGYYAPLREAVAEAAGHGDLLCDAGCGEGYYTERAAEGFSVSLGADLSKYALDLAAKSAKRQGLSEKLMYAAASVYALPLADGCADCVINVFAPCVEAEYMRILRPGGRLIVAAAGRDHLLGMKEVLYETVLPNETRRDLPKTMRLCAVTPMRYEARIPGEDIAPLFAMTPYFYRTKREAAEALCALPSLTTLLDFEIRVYEKEAVCSV